tara:strand:+ start:294 stop:1742 length:1449 start_codon:yes stop_codon:yes gene_type:complete
MGVLCDYAAERAVLAGICQHGEDAYLDVVDMLRPTTFMVDTNRVIWRCIDKVLKEHTNVHFDVPTILSAAEDLGLGHTFKSKEEAKHLGGILQMPVELENIRRFAAKISRLEVGRTLREQLEVAKEGMLDLTGDESVLEIINLAELDFSSLLKDETGSTPQRLGEDALEHLEFLAANPVEQIGFSTGMPVYDAAIGGGLRPATINVIGARPKVGKTILSDNIGYHIASHGIPVLNLDTEMTWEDHVYRSSAMISGVPINEIETGKFGASEEKMLAVTEAAAKLKAVPYYHRSIAGRPFEDQLAIIRRWISKEVGMNLDGTAKDCVIVYDYLKLMDAQGISSDMKEYQLLGFMMTTLHNFAHRYKLPILAFMQLNRDGIDGEDTSAAAGSDRIIWLCSNFSMFKAKSREEIAEDGVDAGNRKLMVLAARHGEGMDQGDYVNCHMQGYCAKITEGETRGQVEINRQENEGYVEEEETDDQIPFE